MAATQSSGGSGMGVVVGVLLAALLAIGAFFIFGGGMLNQKKSVDLNVNLPSPAAPPSAPEIPTPPIPKPQ
ncbi:hypothetical protein QO010_004677 [Caulobacter ginsengisoli]|uniref:Sporulation protein n=1 Tax=Caulobacter ginsengisoli TaxID=400775 RepID=A0ABU0IY08_9CAUL|nr:hypothetical protein [Caulobacter ginsengisoli]MDQ0466880.1 hypothetical protein [Caulobacter ginsengisoli]